MTREFRYDGVMHVGQTNNFRYVIAERFSGLVLNQIQNKKKVVASGVNQSFHSATYFREVTMKSRTNGSLEYF